MANRSRQRCDRAPCSDILTKSPVGASSPLQIILSLKTRVARCSRISSPARDETSIHVRPDDHHRTTSAPLHACAPRIRGRPCGVCAARPRAEWPRARGTSSAWSGGRRPARHAPSALRTSRAWAGPSRRAHRRARRREMAGLVYEFRESLARPPVTYLEGHCLSSGRIRRPTVRSSSSFGRHWEPASWIPPVITEKVGEHLQSLGIESETSAPSSSISSA